MATDADGDADLDAVRAQRVGLRGAMDQVERSIVAAATGRVAEWSAAVRAAMENLSNAFEHHMKVTEASDGLLAEVMQEAPRLARRVDIIKADHATIGAALEGVQRTLRQGDAADDVGVRRLTDDVISLLSQLVQHRHLGADLVYEAYNVDIDAAD